MSNSDLPNGWVIAQIGDVAAKAVQRSPADDDEFIYVDIGSINRDLKIISEPQKLLGKDAPSRARKVINTGDILVSLTRPNLNAVALVGRELDNQIASTGFEVIKPIAVDSRYIFSIVRSNPFIEAISGKVQGALYPAAKSDDVRGYEFFLPPLAEQQQIAAKLDELLAQVHSIKTRLDAISKILKRFRQSVLAVAVSGKLTEDWRQEADQSFSSIKLEEIISESLVGLVRSSSEQYEDSNENTVPYIKMNNIDAFWGIDLNNLVSVECTKDEVKRYSLQKGDWLFNTRNSVELVGKSCVWKENLSCVYNNNILRVRFGNNVLSDFVEIWFRSPQGRKELNSIKSATTSVAAIYQKTLLKQQLDLPPIQEQTEIVKRVEQLFAYADQIEQRVKDAQTRVNHLTQTILAKAFRGELTADWRAQNPNLISGDNSAEALLAKINAQQNAKKLRSRK